MIGKERIPDNISVYTEDVLAQLPDDFILQGGTEGLEHCKVSGLLNRWAITITYEFNKTLDEVYVKGISTDWMEKEGGVLLADLRSTLEKEFIPAQHGDS